MYTFLNLIFTHECSRRNQESLFKWNKGLLILLSLILNLGRIHTYNPPYLPLTTADCRLWIIWTVLYIPEPFSIKIRNLVKSGYTTIAFQGDPRPISAVLPESFVILCAMRAFLYIDSVYIFSPGHPEEFHATASVPGVLSYRRPGLRE